MRTAPFWLGVSLAAMAGCAAGGGVMDDDRAPSPGSTPPADDADPKDWTGDEPDMPPDAPPPTVDLDAGSWTLSNVSDTPRTMGFHARHLALPGGDRWVVWSEVGESSSSDMNIHAAHLGAGGWSSSPVMVVPGAQHTWPEVAVDGDVAALVWNGPERSGMDNDIYLSWLDADGWTEPVDLTSGFDGFDARRDFQPAVAHTPGGGLVVAYLATPIDAFRHALGRADVRVLTVDAAGIVEAPRTVIEGDDYLCGDLDLVVDDSGTAHLLASCGTLTTGHLVYLSDAGGWDVVESSLAGASGAGQADLVAAAGGVHAVWRDYAPCGDRNCGDVFYARHDGHAWQDAVPVVLTSDVDEADPCVAVDESGVVLVAWEERLPERDTDVRVAWAPTSEGPFGEPVNVTPDSPDTRDSPTDASFDPASGLPSVALERVERGTDPLNVDIFVADFAVD